MALPLKVLRVFPNPWAMIHPDHGPQGVCVADTSGRSSGVLRYLGAQPKVNVVEVRDADDPRGNRAFYQFSYPGLNDSLTDGQAIELPPSNPYYRDRLVDGSLVPADERTRKEFEQSARFPTLVSARDAGIADFEAQFGKGSFAEAFKGRAFVPGVKVEGSGGGSNEPGGKGGKG